MGDDRLTRREHVIARLLHRQDLPLSVPATMSYSRHNMADPEQQVNTTTPSEIPTRSKPRRLEVSLPYLAAPSTVKNALDRIRQAATPDRVSPDFVHTVLQIKGGTGDTIAPFLKKIGLVATDGAPTELYRQFRNLTTGGAAIAAAMKFGYKPLSNVNEFFYRLDEKALLALIVQVTGGEANSSTTRQIFSTFKALKEYADFDALERDNRSAIVVQRAPEEPPPAMGPPPPRGSGNGSVGLNLAYTINLNLPATSDQAVFNAIFRSLKEHLITNG